MLYSWRNLLGFPIILFYLFIIPFLSTIWFYSNYATCHLIPPSPPSLHPLNLNDISNQLIIFISPKKYSYKPSSVVNHIPFLCFLVEQNFSKVCTCSFPKLSLMFTLIRLSPSSLHC